MTTVNGLLAQFRVLLNDPLDEQLSALAKFTLLDVGVSWLWPDVFYVTQEIFTLTSDVVQRQYIGSQRVPLGVRLFDTDASDYLPWDVPWRVVNGGDMVEITLTASEAATYTGVEWALVEMASLPPLLSSEAQWNAGLAYGHPGAYQAALFYAMSLATASALDDRIDYTKYTTTGENGVSLNDLVGISAFWLERAEREKARVSLPQPVLAP